MNWCAMSEFITTGWTPSKPEPDSAEKPRHKGEVWKCNGFISLVLDDTPDGMTTMVIGAPTAAHISLGLVMHFDSMCPSCKRVC